MSADNLVLIVKIPNGQYIAKELSYPQFENINSYQDLSDLVYDDTSYYMLEDAFFQAIDILKNKYIEYGIHYLDLMDK